jgi:beta-glucosidase
MLTLRTKPPFVYDPFQAFTHQASLDNSYLLWDFVSQYPTVDPASDVCVVFINAFSSEGGDRVALSDEYSDNLVNGIANQCANTMVVIHNAGIRIVDGFYAHPNVTAIIYAHLPGQMVGPPLVSLMYGEQSFSGRMPYTTAKNATDYGTLLYPTKPDNTSEGFTQSNFTEGVYIDYRAFEANNITARFPFGFGLTYTTFTYSSLTTGLTNPAGNLTALPAAAPFESGGNPRLFDIIANVTAIVTNSGNATAAEVSQLYIGIPNAPAKQLRGFSKDTIVPGGSTLVIFPLTRRDLSVWDVEAQQWRLQSGSYQVYVGKSVEDIQLTATIAIETN